MSKLNKEHVLSSTNNGYDVFQYYLSNYYPESQVREGYNIPNPFLKKAQESGSFNVYKNHSGLWRYKDFAVQNFKGDCFDLIKLLKPELARQSFRTVLKQINNDLKLNLVYQDNEQPLITHSEFDVKQKTFSDFELKYWLQFAITPEVLKIYNVQSLQSFYTRSKSGNQYRVYSKEHDPIFTFSYSNSYKVYRPLSPDKRNKWRCLGKRDSEFLFGFEQIADNQELLIITSGEKDVLTLSALGYNAVCLNSETATLTPEIFTRLLSKANQVIVCYDNDSTGQTCAKKICEDFNIAIVEIPKFAGKDISDFIKIGASVNDVQQIIQGAIVKHAATAVLRMNRNNLPTFKKSVYHTLPTKLSKIFDNDLVANVNDVLLLGMLTLCGAAMPNVKTLNRDGLNSPDLYTIVVGDFSSGKGILNKVRMASKPLNNHIYKQSIEKRNECLAESKHSKKEKNKTPPPFLNSFITSGDISTTAVIQKLQESGGRAFIFETEIDSMTASFKQKWGDFSDLLRKAFHHETISMQRVQSSESENTFFQINDPSISLLLSGTVNQAHSLLQKEGLQNGLYSRLNLYIVTGIETWISRKPTDRQQQFDSDIAFGELFAVWNQHTPEIAVLTKRYSLIAQRIAVILTVLRLFEDEALNETPTYQANDIDVEIGCELAKTCFMHSAFFATSELITKPTKSQLTEKALRLYANGRSYRSIATEIGVSKSTVQNWIKNHS